MKKTFTLLISACLSVLLGWSTSTDPASDEANSCILYTSTDGQPVKLYAEASNPFGVNLVSNTYEDGQGKYLFDGPVQWIGKYAFCKCTTLKTVEIPESATKIENSAFEACLGLVSIDIPNAITEIGNYAFQSCSRLETAIVGNSVATIGLNAFYGCNSLTSIVLGEEVSSIADFAFNRCANLSEITSLNATPPTVAANTLTDIDKSACVLKVPDESVEAYKAAEGWKDFVNIVGIETGEEEPDENCILLYTSTDGEVVNLYSPFDFDVNMISNVYENGQGKMVFDGPITTIGTKSFVNCKTLVTISLPGSVTVIGESAFLDCSNLVSIDIPNSVTIIGKYAFQKCYSLASMQLPNSLTTIDDGAFTACSSLTAVEIPKTVTYLGRGAFQHCSSLATVEMPDALPEIYYGTFTYCTALTAIELPSTITMIGECAFEGCSSLAAIDIPDTVTDIAWGAFKGCSSMAVATIGNSVVKIGGSAFKNCTGLTAIELPVSVAALDNEAFNGCANMSEMVSLNTTPPTVDYECFGNFPLATCVLKVPDESVEAYKAAEGWKDFFNIESTAGLDSIGSAPGRVQDIYNMQGVCVKRNDVAGQIGSLPAGLYIIGNKKVMIGK